MVAPFVVSSEAVESKRGVESERLERLEIIDRVANDAFPLGHDDRLGGYGGEVGVLSVESRRVGAQGDGGEEDERKSERQEYERTGHRG